MDFMNLNQSAHGDREFGFIADPHAARAQGGRRALAATRTSVDRIATWARAACGWHEAQRLKVARFGDNMREVAVTEGDKVEAQIRLGFAVNGYGVGDLAGAVREVADADVDALVDDYERAVRRRRRACARAATGASRCATPRGSSSACARSSTTAASRRSPTPSRICTA